MKFVVTFPVGGPLADRYCEVDAVDELTARLAVIAVYGRRGWACLYRADAAAQEMVVKYGLHPMEFGSGREHAEDYVA